MAEASPACSPWSPRRPTREQRQPNGRVACDNLETQQKKTRLRRAPARQAKKTKIEIGLSSFIRHSPAAP